MFEKKKCKYEHDVRKSNMIHVFFFKHSMNMNSKFYSVFEQKTTWIIFDI